MLAIRALLLMLKEGLRVFNDRLKGQEQLDCKDLPVRSMRCKFSWVTDWSDGKQHDSAFTRTCRWKALLSSDLVSHRCS